MQRILAKGLAPNPTERFTSVGELLDALTHDPAVRRRRILAGIGLVSAIVAAAVGLFHLERRDQQLCGGGRAACEATRVTRVQSDELLDLRMACLQRRREELTATTSLLATADAEMIATAVQSVQQLTPITTCADIEALTAQVSLPRDAGARRAVEAARRDLATATALENAGRYKDGLAVTDRVWTAVQKLDYRPVQAETLQLQGELLRHSGKPDTAEQTLYAALWAAESGRADEVVVRAWTELVYVVGFDQERYDEAERLHRHAAASLERIGGDALLETRLLKTYATVAFAEGDYARADERWRQALGLARRSLRADDARIAEILNNLGAVARRRGELDRAFEYHEKALAIREAAFGPKHPYLATTLNNMAIVLRNRGQPEKAFALHQRALALRVNLEDQEDPVNLAETRFALGRVLAELGDRKRGRELVVLARETYAGAKATQELGEVDAWLGQR